MWRTGTGNHKLLVIRVEVAGVGTSGGTPYSRYYLVRTLSVHTCHGYKMY